MPTSTVTITVELQEIGQLGSTNFSKTVEFAGPKDGNPLFVAHNAEAAMQQAMEIVNKIVVAQFGDIRMTQPTNQPTE